VVVAVVVKSGAFVSVVKIAGEEEAVPAGLDGDVRGAVVEARLGGADELWRGLGVALVVRVLMVLAIPPDPGKVQVVSRALLGLVVPLMGLPLVRLVGAGGELAKRTHIHLRGRLTRRCGFVRQAGLIGN
jgi:hypothetical protein